MLYRLIACFHDAFDQRSAGTEARRYAVSRECSLAARLSGNQALADREADEVRLRVQT